jgi:uncharacterized protein YbjT (DUF2867 family)
MFGHLFGVSLPLFSIERYNQDWYSARSEGKMATRNINRVAITGGDTYLGLQLASALLAEGAEVTLLLREGKEKSLGDLASHVNWHNVDMWNSASLRGRARGHGTVIHTIGSMSDAPKQNITYESMNVIPARNAANMCVSDGVPHFIYLSAANAPWLSGKYIQSKRDVEAYLRKIGLKSSIIRAPIVYERDSSRSIFFNAMTFLGSIPPVSWLHLGRIAPTPLDMFVRGIARIALNPPAQSRIYFAGDLRRLNTSDERRGRIPVLALPSVVPQEQDVLPFDSID